MRPLALKQEPKLKKPKKKNHHYTIHCYQDLSKMATNLLKGAKNTLLLESEDLVHETYLKLSHQRLIWRSRSHFLGTATKLMRRIFIDRIRMKTSYKHGGSAIMVDLNTAVDLTPATSRLQEELMCCLADLARANPKQAKILRLRYQGGLTAAEIARCLDVSTATVTRRLQDARTWLRQRLEPA